MMERRIRRNNPGSSTDWSLDNVISFEQIPHYTSGAKSPFSLGESQRARAAAAAMTSAATAQKTLRVLLFAAGPRFILFFL